MRSDQAGVELVIQTASGILTGRFAPREALTILATQAPQARADARRLVIDDADRAGIYAGLVAAVRAELMARPEDRDLRGVVDDLERLERALTAEGS